MRHHPSRPAIAVARTERADPPLGWAAPVGLAALATAAILSWSTADAADAVLDAQAKMVGTEGNDHGNVSFLESENGVVVKAMLNDLPPGVHGFHLHETGECEPDFEAAGGHVNPDGGEHGFLNAGGPHPGDLPNVHVGEDGNAMVEFFTDRVSLSGETGAPLDDDDGTAVIVHADADTYQAEAGAGGRIACGVIEFGG